MFGRMIGALSGFLLGNSAIGTVKILALGGALTLPPLGTGVCFAVAGIVVGGWFTNGY